MFYDDFGDDFGSYRYAYQILKWVSNCGRFHSRFKGGEKSWEKLELLVPGGILPEFLFVHNCTQLYTEVHFRYNGIPGHSPWLPNGYTLSTGGLVMTLFLYLVFISLFPSQISILKHTLRSLMLKGRGPGLTQRYTLWHLNLTWYYCNISTSNKIGP